MKTGSRFSGRLQAACRLRLCAAAAVCAACGADEGLSRHTAGGRLTEALPNGVSFPNPAGDAQTYSTTGSVDLTGPFFQSLGTNGRACVSCHTPADGWTITPATLQARFALTQGLDPVFRTNDGSNSPNADVSTLAARQSAYSMLLNKGLIRVGIGIPAGAEFELAAVNDPYGYASAAELSLFRRPLPSTNLPFLATVLWDGRETFAGQSIHFDLGHQANDATTGHAQGSTLTAEQQAGIVSFETALFTAQARDDAAGPLDVRGALGGAANLSVQPFHLGINDTLGADPSGAPFNPVSMTLFSAWAGARVTQAQAAVARGEAIFDSRPIAIRGVRGLNDAPFAATIAGTCTTCHNTPNVGNHSVSLPLDLGLTDPSVRTPDQPLYTLRNKSTGELFQTTDPGRALITGLWKDRARFKGPILRALAARAPYFHNGMAASLDDVVTFYDRRFGLGLSAGEKDDLVAFLRSL